MRPNPNKDTTGTARRDRQTAVPIDLPAVEHRLPAQFKGNKHAREFWRTVVDPLCEAGGATAVDLPALVACCTLWCQLQALQAEANGLPTMTYTTPNGAVAQYPHFKAIADLSAKLVRSVSALGLTPTGRAKLTTPVHVEADPLVGFLERVK